MKVLNLRNTLILSLGTFLIGCGGTLNVNTEQPSQTEKPTQSEQPSQTEKPTQSEQPAQVEQPTQVEQPEQPAPVEQPEQPAPVEQPEQPIQVEEPEQPIQVEEPEQPQLSYFQETAFVVLNNDDVDQKAEEWKRDNEFNMVDSKCDSSNIESKSMNKQCTHAYELLNIHYAYGYGLSGEGQTIAIMDSAFNVNEITGGTHQEFDSEGKITTSGTLFSAHPEIIIEIDDDSYEISADYHGNFVSSIAAGNHDGIEDDINIMGVAYNSNLHISDYYGSNGQNFHPDYWAEATYSAIDAGAIVQNNSWGLPILKCTEKVNGKKECNEQSVSDIQQIILENELNSVADVISYLNLDYGLTDDSVNNYITALDNFQEQGVVVYALSNDNYNNMNDADLSAGLPEFFPELDEAWITVANVDFIGSQSITDSSVGNKTEYWEVYQSQFTENQNSIEENGSNTETNQNESTDYNDNIYLLSAPCGQTASYCLIADGTWLEGATTIVEGIHQYESNLGTSFAAPQISGGVALLAEAFPNHTPEQLVDRLLASANNSFFTNEETDGKYGITDFGNGVEHQYSFNFGHGFMDLYAALNPIGDKSVLFGKSIDNSVRINLDDSYLLTDKAFGDALQKAFQNDFIVFHDGLNAGFGSKLTNSISQTASSSQGISLKQLLNQDRVKQPINSFNTNSLTILQPSLNKSLPLQCLYAGYSTIDMPDISYLNSAALGAGINGAVNLFDGHLLYSFSQSLESTDNNLGQDKSLVLAYSSNQNSATRAAIASGLSMEQGSLLDSVGSGAWGMDQKHAQTTYMALTGEHDLSHDMSLKMMAALGRTHMDSSAKTLFGGAEGIVTKHIDLQLNKSQTFIKGDLLTFKLSQPLRANAGQMTINMPQGSDADGNLHYKQKTFDIKPSGQQLDFGVNYHAEINSQFTLGLNSLYTKQANHNKDNPDHYSMTMTMAWDQIKFGMRGEQFEAGDLKRSAQLSIGNKF